MSKTTTSGRCLCGAVQFRVHRSFLGGVKCYCRMCRQAHGGPYSLHVAMRRDQFELLEGRLEVYASSSHGRREFCPQCGSHVLVHGQTADSSVAVPAGLLDAAEVVVTAHIFVDDLVSWHQIQDDLPQHAAWPPDVQLPA